MTIPALSFVLFLAAAANALGGAAPAQPNIILIFADDMGYADVGCFGAKAIKTPVLDRMASEGLRLTSFYAQAVCGPSRAALMIGSYPIRIAEPGNRKSWHTIPHPREVTIAETLKTAGYTTGIIGKWHLCARDPNDPTGWDAATMPNSQGFDYFYGTPVYNGSTVRVTDSRFRSQIHRNREMLVHAVENWDNSTQDYTREAVAFIRENKGRPFFLYVAHNMPHIPLGASDRFRGRSAAGPYGDTIEEIDWSTGRILDAVKESGIDERTLIIFTSDNGPWIEPTVGNRPDGRPLIPPDHSGAATPLRGYKYLTWEGGFRVPCIARWPGKIPAGQSSAAIASTLDFHPTFAALAGAELPQARLDGRDIRPLFFGGPAATSPHDVLYYYSFTHLQAVRAGPWKLVAPRPEYPKWTRNSGRFFGDGVKEPELYDLENDVGETVSVALQNPDVVARLTSLLEQARQDLGDYDRVGKGARFYDPGQARPDIDDWKTFTRKE